MSIQNPCPFPSLTHWSLLTDAEIERIRDAALSVVEKHGVRLCNPSIINSLSRQGFKVDTASSTVWPTRRQLEMVEETARRHAPPVQAEPVLRRGLPTAQSVGHNMTLYYDCTEKKRRAATLGDIRNVVKAWHMLPEIGYTGPCMTAQDVPSAIEPIASSVEVMRHTHKVRGCPEMLLADQLPYLEELETIMTGSTVRYHANGCSMTRFTIDERAAQCLVAVAKNGLDYWWVNSSTIMGINAPVTWAGALACSMAETVGGWLGGWALNPEVELNAIPLTGQMDMRTGRILFSTPECVVVDSALYQIFYRLYGMRIGLCTGYTDAKIPGMQAINDKMLKSLGYGLFIDKIGGQVGTLEAGNIYSPTQQIIDLEINRQTAQLAVGITVDEDNLAVNEILEVLADSSGMFLGSEHTRQYMRSSSWMPKLFDHTPYENDELEQTKANQIVEKAEISWQDALMRYDPSGVDAAKVKAAEAVLVRAKKKLL